MPAHDRDVKPCLLLAIIKLSGHSGTQGLGQGQTTARRSTDTRGLRQEHARLGRAKPPLTQNTDVRPLGEQALVNRCCPDGGQYN